RRVVRALGRPAEHRAPPRRRHLPRRRHRLARPRTADPPHRRLPPRRLWVAERHLRQPATGRVGQARGRRQAADRQVQALIPDPMTMARDLQPEIELPDPAVGNGPSGVRDKAMTIGAVCKVLKPEFPEISISKIRYLEDQKLLQPKRTPGGYRLYSQQDVGRLRTILRLQRDEFLPLRVIRSELARGRTEA